MWRWINYHFDFITYLLFVFLAFEYFFFHFPLRNCLICSVISCVAFSRYNNCAVIFGICVEDERETGNNRCFQFNFFRANYWKSVSIRYEIMRNTDLTAKSIHQYIECESCVWKIRKIYFISCFIFLYNLFVLHACMEMHFSFTSCVFKFYLTQ